LQGAVMFIRLVGEEKIAISEPKASPFEDVTQAWAMPYIGQMYAQGYSNGTSLTTYGIGAMSADQFATYILRALGYSEMKGDFVWSTSLSTLLELDIISKRDFNIIKEGSFLRDYAVKLASSALDATLKDSDTTFYQVLLEKDAIALYSSIRPLPVSTGTLVTSYEDMTSIFQRMHANLQYSATLDTSGLSLEMIKDWLNKITNTSSSDIWGWNIVSTYSTDKNYPSKVSIKWLYTDGYEVAYSYLYPASSLELSAKNQQIREVVDSFLQNEITQDMSNKDKIKAIHDYLIKTTKYDTLLVHNTELSADNTSDSYMAYGVLVKNLGVCDGYAKAFNMFMDILGIPSERVVGTSHYNNKPVDHAWNRVYVDNQYLNIDVTWDDPVPDRGSRIRYDYYLITDKKLAKDHNWGTSQFNPNYY
ncbi:MAG TPA: transglutaminase domain-containing protein, partial [Anaerovoracaceae bacterium]|nr:transglutaminase domain-containing protein [Anaerovoracaceae bacterium]